MPNRRFKTTKTLKFSNYLCAHWLILSLFIFLAICPNLKAEQSRESQLFNIETAPIYLFNNKNLYTSLKTNFHNYHNSDIKSINPSIGFNHSYKKNSNYIIFTNEINLDLSYNSYRKEFSEDDSLDIHRQLVPVNLFYSNELRKHLKINENLYIGLKNRSDIKLLFESEEEYKSDINPNNLPDNLKDILVSDWQKSKIFGLDYYVSLAPQIGIGHINDRSRHLKALQLESALLKKSVIKFPLSERTFKELTYLLGTYSEKSLRNKSAIEELKAKITALISKDASFDKEMLRYISPLDLKKILLIKYKNVQSGIDFSISSPCIYSLNSYNKKTEFPWDIYNKYKTFKERSIRNEYRQDLTINTSLNKNLGPYLFVNLDAKRILLTTETSPDFKDSENKIKWDNLLDVRWNFNLTLIPHYRYHIEGGVINQRTYLLIPNNPPEILFFSQSLFIEDYLEIKTTFDYKFEINDDPYLYLYSDKKSVFPEERKLVFNLLLCYNF